MSSHALTFCRFQLTPVQENQGFISCDVNSIAEIVPNSSVRGAYATGAQGWEILFLGCDDEGIPTVRIRNPYGVYLGVDSFANNELVNANAGLSDMSLWTLEILENSNYKIYLQTGSTKYDAKVSGTSLKIFDVNTEPNPSIWRISIWSRIP